MRRLAAGLVFELMIALPDDTAVFVVAVPDLRAVPSAAASAADLPGEYGRPAVFRISGSHGEATCFKLSCFYLTVVRPCDILLSVSKIKKN